MDLSVIFPRAGLRGDADCAELAEALAGTSLQWEIVIVGSDDRVSKLTPDDPRIRVVNTSAGVGTFRRGYLEARGEWLIALETSCAGLIAQIPAIVDELQHSTQPDLVLSLTAEEPSERGWPRRIRDRMYRLAFRRSVAEAPLGVYGFRRGVLDAIGVDERANHPLGLLARAFDRGLDIRKLPSTEAALRRAPLTRHLGFLLTRRPALYYGSFGMIALLVGAIGVSVGGIRWAFHPEMTDWGGILSLAVVGIAGAQVALFSYLFDRQQGMGRLVQRATHGS